jgi:hypothetical protein
MDENSVVIAISLDAFDVDGVSKIQGRKEMSEKSKPLHRVRKNK